MIEKYQTVDLPTAGPRNALEEISAASVPTSRLATSCGVNGELAALGTTISRNRTGGPLDWCDGDLPTATRRTALGHFGCVATTTLETEWSATVSVESLHSQGFQRFG